MPAHRVPSAVLQLRGAFANHPDRARPDEPDGVGEIGDPPNRLTEAEAEAWRTIVGESIDGVLCRSDRTALEIASRLLAQMWEMGREFPREKWVELRHYLSAFGMTPADRSRVSVSHAKQPQQPTGLAKYR